MFGTDGTGKPTDPRRRNSWSAQNDGQSSAQTFEGPLNVNDDSTDESGPFGQVLVDLGNVRVTYIIFLYTTIIALKIS